MSDNKDQIFPEATVGALIYNDAGQVLLLRGPKFGSGWVVPGGHVEVGETLIDALKREVKEETNLDVDSIEFLSYQDAINPPEYQKQRHYVFLDFCARSTGGEVKFNDEFEEYNWFDPKDLNDVPLAFGTDKLVKAYLEKINSNNNSTIKQFNSLSIEKKGVFGNKCKHCEKLKSEVEEYHSGWQRALADYKNLQTETSKRRSEWAQMSEVQILEEFIPVYEHLKLAINNEQLTSDAASPWVEGVKYVLKQFADILKSHGVEEIKTVGEKFDPKYHEAVGHEEVEGKSEGEIIKEISGGYIVGDKVIRAARVIIAK